jgi:hypothetical protein
MEELGFQDRKLINPKECSDSTEEEGKVPGTLISRTLETDTVTALALECI